MRTDATIQKDVVDELNWDPQLDGPGIGVSVKSGVVTLTGDVKSYRQKLIAEKAAFRVAGVRAVSEQLVVGPSSATEKTDRDIAEAALNALKWDTAIDESRIQVSVGNGIVTLTGQLDWDFQRQAARNAIGRLAGVKQIHNNLTLKPAPGQTDIRQKIIDAYQRSATVDAGRIHVDVTGSHVLLTGKVRSIAEKYDAARAVWSAPGITVVENRLTVLPENELVY